MMGTSQRRRPSRMPCIQYSVQHLSQLRRLFTGTARYDSSHRDVRLSPSSKTKWPSLSGGRSGGDGRFGTTNADVRVGAGTPGRATVPRFCRLSGGSSCREQAGDSVGVKWMFPSAATTPHIAAAHEPAT